jgi:cysteine desulfurase
MIYFDNAATTKPSEAVLSLFQRYSESFFANSSSRHALGREANKCL